MTVLRRLPPGYLPPVFISVIFVLLVLANPAWIYSVIGWVDAWAYFGHAVDPIGLRNAMPSHPAGDLLPNIWPAALLYYVLPPLAANFVYKWLCFLVSGLFFFAFVRREAGVKTAVWAVLLLLMHRFFLIATGSEYTDGRVILYLSGCLYFLGRPKSNASLFMAGVFFACSAATAVLSLIYGLPLLIYALGSRWYRSSKVSLNLFVLPSLGFAAAMLLFASVHWLYTGEFYFFRNTLEKAENLMGMVRGNRDFNFFGLEWLYPTLFAVFAFPFGRTLFKQRLVFWLMNLSAFIPLLYLQFFKNQETIWQLLYFNQIIPVTMACLAITVIAPLAETVSDRRLFQFGTAAIFITAYAVFLLSSRFADQSAAVADATAFLLMAVGAGFIFYRKFHAWVFFTFLAVYLHMNLSVQGFKYLEPAYKTSPLARSRPEVFMATYKWVELVKQIDPARKSWLWYNSEGDQYLLRGFAAASHLWQGRVYNERLPLTDIPMGESGVVSLESLTAGGLILITANDEEFLAALKNIRLRNIELVCEGKLPLRVNDERQLDVRLCGLYK